MSKDIFNDKFRVSYNDGEGFYCAYPLAISIIDNKKRQTNLRILFSEINSMVQCLSAPFSPPVRLATMSGDYTLEWLVNDREVAFIRSGTKQAVVLSEDEAQGLVSLVIQKMSSQTNSQHHIAKLPLPSPDPNPFCVIFDDHGEYPLHVMIAIDSDPTELHIKLDEVNDFVYCLSTPGCPSLCLDTREGPSDVLWLLSDRIEIAKDGKMSLLMRDFRALELA
jgi:hypothetical protein